MRGRVWLSYFTKIAAAKYRKFTKQHRNDTRVKYPEWTEFMWDVMEGVADKVNCDTVRRRRSEEEGYSGEYLNIDVFLFDKVENIVVRGEQDPFVLPRAVVELENSTNILKISRCLWKILCVRSPIRVLICYQKGEDNVENLRQELENVVWQGSLMKGTDGDLLVIIGNDNVFLEASCEKYLTVFEWRNDSLKKVEGLKW